MKPEVARLAEVRRRVPCAGHDPLFDLPGAKAIGGMGGYHYHPDGIQRQAQALVDGFCRRCTIREECAAACVPTGPIGVEYTGVAGGVAWISGRIVAGIWPDEEAS